jgi:hypothetical protein
MLEMELLFYVIENALKKVLMLHCPICNILPSPCAISVSVEETHEMVRK